MSHPSLQATGTGAISLAWELERAINVLYLEAMSLSELGEPKLDSEELTSFAKPVSAYLARAWIPLVLGRTR